MIAAVYARVSTSEQAEHGYSLPDQIEKCSDRARALGAAEVVVFEDGGESGAKLDRPGLSQLREAVRAGAVQLVVMLDPDRLARKLALQLLVTEEIDRAGIRLEFLQFQRENSAEGNLFYSMRGAIAEYEREKIRQRTLSGREKKGREGKIVSTGSWYGYKKIDVGVYEPDPVTAPVVREIFRLTVVERVSPGRIARILSEEGAPPPRGAVWHITTVRRILGNPVYKGVVFNFRERYRHKVRWADLEGQPGISVARIEPLVDAATFDEAQGLSFARPRAHPPDSEAHLLQGLLFCGKCGAKMHHTSTVVGGKRYNYYRCLHSMSGRKFGPDVPKCDNRVQATPIEASVWREALEILNHPERVLEVLTEQEGVATAARERERLTEQLSFWEAKQARTVEAFTAGWMDRTRADDAIQHCRQQIEGLRREIDAVDRLTSQAAGRRNQRRDIRRFCRQVLAQVDAASTEDRHRILLLLMERVVFDGKVLRIVGRFDAGALQGQGLPFIVEAGLSG